MRRKIHQDFPVSVFTSLLTRYETARMKEEDTLHYGATLQYNKDQKVQAANILIELLEDVGKNRDEINHLEISGLHTLLGHLELVSSKDFMGILNQGHAWVQ